MVTFFFNLRNQFFCLFGGGGGVGGVGIGADFVGEGLGDGGTAHHDLDAAPEGGGIQGGNGGLQGGHGGGQQGGAGHDFNIGVFFNRGEELVHGHIHAQVDYLEAGGLDHHGHQVFADVVEITGHGADDDLAQSAGGAGGQMGLQNLHALLHGFGGDQHFRHETAPSKQLFISPLHPYTKALLSAIPSTDIHNPQKRILLQGEVVSPINPKPGCRFAARCPYACEECKAPQKLEELLRVLEQHPDLDLVVLNVVSTFGAMRVVKEWGKRLHVISTNRISEMESYMLDGSVDAVVTHQPWIQTNVSLDVLFQYLVWGKKPRFTTFFANDEIIIAENMRTKRQTL